MPILGCGGNANEEKQATGPPFQGISLTVAVIGDEAIVTSLNRLTDEWNAQTGSTLTITSVSEADFLAQSALDADIAIVPSYLVGIVRQRKWIAPPGNAVQENPQLKWRDIFSSLRSYEAAWDQRTVGIPLGSPRLLLAYRADVFRQFDREPPETWTEYYELAAFFAEQGTTTGLGQGAAEPNVDNWPALVFLAKAAPLAKHKDYFSSLFDVETMAPLVNGPAFVETLEEWARNSNSVAAGESGISPEAAYGLVRSGDVAMAITWPSAQWGHASKSPNAEVGFTSLPGSTSVYVPGATEPLDTPLRHVALTSFSGCVGVVSSQTEGKTRDAAWQFLMQLVGESWGTQVSTSSPQLMLSRSTQTPDATRWLPADDAGAAGGLALALDATMNADDGLPALPLPGRDRYLQSLTDGVQRALAGEQSAAESLDQVATEWSQITAELGVAQQREHYRAGVTRGY